MRVRVTLDVPDNASVADILSQVADKVNELNTPFTVEVGRSKALIESGECVECPLRDIDNDRIDSFAGAVLLAQQLNSHGPMDGIVQRYPRLYEITKAMVGGILAEGKGYDTTSKAIAIGTLALAEEACKVNR